MKKQLYLAFLALSAFGLITACSKKNNDPAAASPVVGTYDIQRYEVTDVTPVSSAFSNFTDSSAAGIAGNLDIVSDTYIFNADQTVTNNYVELDSLGKQYSGTANGTWTYNATTQLVTLTPTAQNGQAVNSINYYFNPNRNELSTGKQAQQTRVSGVTQIVNFNLNIIYRKRR